MRGSGDYGHPARPAEIRNMYEARPTTTTSTPQPTTATTATCLSAASCYTATCVSVLDTPGLTISSASNSSPPAISNAGMAIPAGYAQQPSANSNQQPASHMESSADATTNNSPKQLLSSFSFFNVQGYIPQTKQSKVNYIHDHLLDGNKLFIGLSETWLNEHLDAELDIAGYTVFRSDSTRPKNKRGRFGGGVAMYIRDDIASTSKTILKYSNKVVEVIATYSRKENLLLATVYRQPDDLLHGRPSTSFHFNKAMTQLSNTITSLDSTPDIIIGGDFNLPHASWPDCMPANQCPSDEREMIAQLNSLCTEHLLSQIVQLPTHFQGNTLDLIITNNTNLIHNYYCTPVPRSISHHAMINVQTQYKSLQAETEHTTEKLSPLDRLNFNSKEIDWEAVNKAFSEINWESMLTNNDPDCMLDSIYKVIQDTTTRFVPERKKPSKKKSRAERIVNSLKKRKRRINKQLRSIKSDSKKERLHQELIQAEIKLQRLYKQSHEYCEAKAVSAIQENVKYFYSYAKNKSKIKSKVGPLLDKGTMKMSADSTEMANLLADQYDAVFSLPSTSEPTIDDSSTPINNIVINAQEIIEAIDELKSTAAPGADGIPAILLKKCKNTLALPLTTFWNECMKTSYIPQSLQTSIITPLHKGGNKSEAANYRPVALTSHIIKIYEKVIRKHLTAYLESTGGLNKNQHGFRAGRSCLTQLLAHYDNIITLLEDGFNVDTIYLDFAKAFDKVDHNILLKKALTLGINGKTLKWIQAFLKDRNQRVIVNGKLSTPRQVISGVPQGSVIGPLLFLILIGDIDKNTTSSTVASFADDTRVTKGIKCEMDAVDLQNDIFHIYGWSETNNMKFNSLKFELLRFGKNRDLKKATSYVSPESELIEEKQSVRDLGVELSADTTFKDHISNIIASAKRMSSWVLRTFTTRERIPMLTLYKSLIRPLLEYSSPLWSPIAKGDIQRLEEIQHSFIRKIKGVDRNYMTALNQLNLYSLEKRRGRYAIIHIWEDVRETNNSVATHPNPNEHNS